MRSLNARHTFLNESMKNYRKYGYLTDKKHVPIQIIIQSERN